MAKGKKQEQPRGPIYSLDTAAVVCAYVAEGLTIKDIAALPDMPGKTTLFKWLAEHDDFANLYARARDERADMLADEVVNIADTDPDPNKARVRIDARKWWAAKVNPKRYGDKLQTENVSTTYVVSDKPLTNDEWKAKYCLEAPGGTAGSTH